MKVKIKSYNGELYGLTLGKHYEVISGKDRILVILDDLGCKRVLYLPCCSHLKDGEWEIVDET